MSQIKKNNAVQVFFLEKLLGKTPYQQSRESQKTKNGIEIQKPEER